MVKAARKSEPRITPAMVRRLKTRLSRAWLVLPDIMKETHPILDAWAAAENARRKP